ncbi:hypothetical protein F5148DRAFT_977498 [Russula earlei]|uniref:Uncharacterized protein n=1 Tax=Russula earlei TaxID=71964 RepID=A0ACC0UFA5_9AGAM|nr:hypothetical protein F5148DRAFT_977498 [Russula earlei]
MATPDPPNSLGLDLVNPDPEPIVDSHSTLASPPTPPPQPTTESSTDATSPDTPDATNAATATGTTEVDDPPNYPPKSTVLKKTPYVNPDRVKTGGLPKDKLTDEELAERMARMRAQNEKIKQRRLDVAADEDAFKQTQAAERQRQAQMRKVQETINRTREQSARRKMDKMQSREWDSEKKAEGWPSTTKPERPAAPSTTRTNSGDDSTEADASQTGKPREDTNRGRGFVRRGRFRGGWRGRGQNRERAPTSSTSVPVPLDPPLEVENEKEEGQ